MSKLQHGRSSYDLLSTAIPFSTISTLLLVVGTLVYCTPKVALFIAKVVSVPVMHFPVHFTFYRCPFTSSDPCHSAACSEEKLFVCQCYSSSPTFLLNTTFIDTYLVVYTTLTLRSLTLLLPWLLIASLSTSVTVFNKMGFF